MNARTATCLGVGSWLTNGLIGILWDPFSPLCGSVWVFRSSFAIWLWGADIDALGLLPSAWVD